MGKKITCLCLLLAASMVSGNAFADATSGTLYYTTFSGGENVWKVNYNFNGVSFTLGPSTGIAATNGADGILFAPDGNLIIAGQGADGFAQLHEITPAGAPVTSVFAGTGSYHMALSSEASNAILYNMWNGPCTGSGCSSGPAISATVLSGGGLASNGVAYTVSCAAASPGCSTDVRGVVFDPKNGKWYYGTAGDGGSGDFGEVVFNDVAHTATLTRLLNNVYAHGVTFDPFTNDIIMSSGTGQFANGVAQQFDPSTGTIVATSTCVGCGDFDQSAADGKGHLFLASNAGFLGFVDYDASGLISSGTFRAPFLAGSLDDIAPIAGIGGGGQVPEPGSILLLGTGLAGLAGVIRKRSKK